MQQITDTKTLRKLLRRVEEIPEVKLYLEGFVDSEKAKLSKSSFEDLLGMKKVKENQHMTALLTEIFEYVKVSNFDAAKSAAKRVLEAEPKVTTPPLPPLPGTAGDVTLRQHIQIKKVEE